MSGERRPRRSSRYRRSRNSSIPTRSDEGSNSFLQEIQHEAEERSSAHPMASSPSKSSQRRSIAAAIAAASSIEEGDYVWVHDTGIIGVPALVVRVGFVYDEAKDREHAVMIVHTEDGEEREIRDRTVIKLPDCHHPKQRSPLSVHDLSVIPLSSTELDGTMTQVFSREQLENIALYTIRAHYRVEQIYTWVDRVLVSVNPMNFLPIYTPEKMMVYHNSGQLYPFDSDSMECETPPHVFALAQNALHGIQDSMEDQAIVIIGESGSGKSEAAKLVVQYLCEIGESRSHSENESDPAILHPIGQLLLHSFTVLEAFGNASTPHNRNSSRFAKMISVEFNKHGHVIGGGFTTHLFEKSRVIELRRNERNFNIFYQVLAHVQHDPALRDSLDLNRPISEFALLQPHEQEEENTPSNSSSSTSRMINSLNGVEESAAASAAEALDARDYRDLMASLSALRIRKHQRQEIVRIITALLHLGNVDFVPLDPNRMTTTSINGEVGGGVGSTPSDGEDGLGSSVRESNALGGRPASPSQSSSGGCALKDPSRVVLAAKLLEVEPVLLDNYFRTRQFFSKDGNKTVSTLKVVSMAQAKRARDTFIRSVYEALFRYVVELLNGVLGGIFDRYEKSNLVVNTRGIHVLDMMGFENLFASQEGSAFDPNALNPYRYNGFEQLCANYLSEKMQAFYLQKALDLPTNGNSFSYGSMDLGRALQNDDMMIDESKNGCLTLFESTPFGIFALLNEHSKLRSQNDEDLVSKILAGNDGIRSLHRPKLPQEMASSGSTTSASPTSKRRSSASIAHKTWRNLFIVEHFCGPVTYHGKDLASKNTLTISSTCAAIMQSSKNSVLHAAGAAQLAADSAKSAVKSGQSKVRQSLSSREAALRKPGSSPSKQEAMSTSSGIMNEADNLLSALQCTGKHFLLCIRPSDPSSNFDLVSNQIVSSSSVYGRMAAFESEYVLKQLQSAHIVDLMKGSHSVLKIPLTFNAFFRRYENICGHRGDIESLVRSLSTIGILEEDHYREDKAQKTIFMTSSQWKKLEQARHLYISACASVIQRNMIKAILRRKAKNVLAKMKILRDQMKKHEDSSVKDMKNASRVLLKALVDCQEEMLELLHPKHQTRLEQSQEQEQPRETVALSRGTESEKTDFFTNGSVTKAMGMRALDVSDLNHVRVFVEAKSRLSQLEEEAYVTSVVQDAALNGHKVVIEYAKQIAMKYCPSVDTDHLKVKNELVTEVKKTPEPTPAAVDPPRPVKAVKKPHLEQEKEKEKTKKDEKIEILREAIIENQEETLMAELATTESSASPSAITRGDVRGEIGADVIEKKLATMVIIRSLEEKRAVDALTKVLASHPMEGNLGQQPAKVARLRRNLLLRQEWKPTLEKILSLGLEKSFPNLPPSLEEKQDQKATQMTTSISSPPPPSSSSTAVSDETKAGILDALQHAHEEENTIAMDHIVKRLKAVHARSSSALQSSLVKESEQKVQETIRTLSSHVEKKQRADFLKIAYKYSKDVVLISEAIDIAIEKGGVAKWDLNLKNARKEIERLKAGPSVVLTSTNPPSDSKNGDHEAQSAEELLVWKIWKCSSYQSLKAMQDQVEELVEKNPLNTWCLELFQTKMDRLEKMNQLNDAINHALRSTTVPSRPEIEQLLENAIQNGLKKKIALRQLFDALDGKKKASSSLVETKRNVFNMFSPTALRKNTPTAAVVTKAAPIVKKASAPVVRKKTGLEATIEFLDKRIETKKEVREDAYTLLTAQMQHFSRQQLGSGGANNSNGPRQDNEILTKASRLKRTLEKVMGCRRQLENLLTLPAESRNIGIFEQNLKVADEAGVTGKLYNSVRERLETARSKKKETDLRVQLREETGSVPPPRVSPLLSPSPSFTADAGPDGTVGDFMLDGGLSSGKPEEDAIAFALYDKLRDRYEQKLYWEGRVLTQSLCVYNDEKQDTSKHESQKSDQAKDETEAKDADKSENSEQNATIASSSGQKNQLAIAINKCILGYMRDRIVFYREMLAHSLLQIGFCEPELVDEIYLQLLKQLTKNPKRDSSLRGWYLLVLCSCSFAPSVWLEKYVILFLQAQVSTVNSFWRLVKNLAQFALKKLQNIMENGATGFLPSLEEIRAFEARPPFLTNIELAEGTLLAGDFPVSPEMTVAQMVEVCCHFLGVPDEVVQYLGFVAIAEKVNPTQPNRRDSSPGTGLANRSAAAEEEDDLQSSNANTMTSIRNSSSSSGNTYFHKFLSLTTFLKSGDYLSDLFERELVRGREIRFVLKIRLVPMATVAAAAVSVSTASGTNAVTGSSFYSGVFFQDEICLRLVYLQVVEDIIQGFLPLVDLEIVLRMSSLAIAVDLFGMNDAILSDGASDLALEGDDDAEIEVSSVHLDSESGATVFDSSSGIRSDGLPNSVDELLEASILDYIPTEWHSAFESEEIWAEEILNRMQAWRGKNVNELQRLFVEEAMRHRLYGAVFFPAKVLLPRNSRKKELAALCESLGLLELGNYFVLAVNGLGIHFVGRDGSILGSFGYDRVLDFGGTYQQYTLVLKSARATSQRASGTAGTTGSLGAGGTASSRSRSSLNSSSSSSSTANSSSFQEEHEEVQITTKYADELTSLLCDYKRLFFLSQET